MLSEAEVAKKRRQLDDVQERTSLATVMDTLSPGVLIVSSNGEVEMANEMARALLDVLEGQTPTHLDIARELKMYREDGSELTFDKLPYNAIVRDRRPVRGFVFCVDRPDGERMWLCCNASLVSEADPESSVAVSLTDVTELHLLRERVDKSVMYDAVTGLPSLTLALRKIGELLETDRKRDLEASDVVMVINFDKLKELNDSLGHLRGDRALALTAERLRAALPARHLVGRVVGAEFVAVLTGLDEDGIDDISDLIHLLLTDPTDIDGNDLRMRASVGLVRLRQDDDRTAEEIIGDADTAMYHAKMKGGGHTVDFDRLRLTGV